MNYSVKIIFGKEQVEKFYNGIELTKEEKNNFIKEYFFESIEQKEYFLKGMDEAVGWLDFIVYNEKREIDLKIKDIL